MIMISTKGRYALRVMVDLAQRGQEGYMPLKEIAQRQGISEKYLESILKSLVRSRMLVGIRGKGGGYQLTREPGEYTVAEILTQAEGDLAPVSCLESGAQPCPRRDICETLPMWEKLNDLIRQFFEGVTLADLIVEKGGEKGKDA